MLCTLSRDCDWLFGQKSALCWVCPEDVPGGDSAEGFLSDQQNHLSGVPFHMKEWYLLHPDIHTPLPVPEDGPRHPVSFLVVVVM